MALDDITNFVALAPGLGTSGQPTREQFSEIADAGYRTVVNLALASSDDAIADEGSIVAGLGMRYVHIPVDFSAPSADELVTFLRVMRAVDDRPVWVHCVVNWRVSAFSYHYLRVVRELPEADCRSPILDSWEMDPAWTAFMALDASAL